MYNYSKFKCSKKETNLKTEIIKTDQKYNLRAVYNKLT